MDYSREISEARDDFKDAMLADRQPSLEELINDMECRHPKAYTIYSRDEPLSDYCPDCCRWLP